LQTLRLDREIEDPLERLGEEVADKRCVLDDRAIAGRVGV
jgi:hypothetical protein